MRVVAWLLITAVLVLFGIFIWPTRYRYDHTSTGSATFIVRFDRFSGRGEVFNPLSKTWVQ